MNKVIILLPVMALFLVGCASNPPAVPTEKVVIQKAIEHLMTHYTLNQGNHNQEYNILLD